MISSVAVLYLFTITISSGRKLHEYMTKKEIQSIFNCDGDNIHEIEYEVIPVFHRKSNGSSDEKRTSTIHFTAFNQVFSLDLEKNEHLLIGSDTPIFTVKTQLDSKIKYTRIQNPFPKDFKVYQNKQKRAALTEFSDSNGRFHLDGPIGENDIFIRSLPLRFHNSVLRNFKGIPDYFYFPDYNENFREFSRDYFLQTHHIAVKASNQTEPTFGTDLLYWDADKLHETNSLENDDGLYSDESTEVDELSLKKPVTASSGNYDTVYPEILIVLDYKTFETHGNNIEELLLYMAAFWNAVDLRFRSLNDPRVRLNIAGIIIPEDENAAPFMEKHCVGKNLIEVEKTLAELGGYFSEEFPKDLNAFDIVVGIFNRAMRSYNEDGSFNDDFSGVAFVGGACSNNGEAAAIVKDKGGFDGITSAAHELAHSMGVPHDGDVSRFGSAKSCLWDDGYLMSYKIKDSRALNWSSCSQRAIRNFLRSNYSLCLRNKPSPGNPYPRILPGKLMSRDEQCVMLFGPESRAYSDEANSCVLLKCVNWRFKGLWRSHSTSPAEGTPCGERAICIDGTCVEDTKTKN